MFNFQAASAVIKESVEPLLEEYRPSGITSLKFSKLSLGTVAPKIEGMAQWRMWLHFLAFTWYNCFILQQDLITVVMDFLQIVVVSMFISTKESLHKLDIHNIYMHVFLVILIIYLKCFLEFIAQIDFFRILWTILKSSF